MGEQDQIELHNSIQGMANRIHALEKELADIRSETHMPDGRRLSDWVKDVMIERDQSKSQLLARQNALKEANGMLRAFRKSMDSELPFPSREKLSAIIDTINLVLGESKP